jgi:hypothetical protein
MPSMCFGSWNERHRLVCLAALWLLLRTVAAESMRLQGVAPSGAGPRSAGRRQAKATAAWARRRRDRAVFWGRVAREVRGGKSSYARVRKVIRT